VHRTWESSIEAYESLPERRAARAGRELEHALTTAIPTTGVHYRPDVSMKAVVLR